MLKVTTFKFSEFLCSWRHWASREDSVFSNYLGEKWSTNVKIIILVIFKSPCGTEIKDGTCVLSECGWALASRSQIYCNTTVKSLILKKYALIWLTALVTWCFCLFRIHSDMLPHRNRVYTPPEEGHKGRAVPIGSQKPIWRDRGVKSQRKKRAVVGQP